MAKNANEKSINAKAYINGKIDDMRQQLKWVDKATEHLKWLAGADKLLKKELLKNFREETASPEYQKNLKVVHDDTQIIREYAKQKKWWAISAKEFKDAKTEFYWKDMDLGPDGEKLWGLLTDWQVSYLIDKFWNDRALWIVLDRIRAKGTWNLTKHRILSFKNLSKSSAKRILENDSYWFFDYPKIFKDSVYNDDEIIQLMAERIYRSDPKYIRLISSKMSPDNQKKLVWAIKHWKTWLIW